MGLNRSTSPRISVPEVRALDEIQRAPHHPQVDALTGGAALDVAYIALERNEESLP